jgi:hypothetical protein
MKQVFLISLIVLLNMIISPQDITYIKGKVISLSGNDLEEPQKDITVLIENTGDRDKTDQNGLFKISLNKKFKPGDKVTFAIEKEGWVIQYPLFGEDRLPSDPEKDQIKIRITQKGSAMLIDENQLNQYIDYYINKTLSHKNSLILGDFKPDLESLIFKLTEIYGFTSGEWGNSFKKYFNKILSDTSGFHEKGIVEFARENYGQAAVLFVRSAESKMDKFTFINQNIIEINKKRIELIKETTRDFRLAAESYFEAKNFDSSIVQYNRALEFIEYSEDWEEYVSILNRIASCFYYLSYQSYNDKKIQRIDSAKTYLNMGLGLAKKNSLVEWEWKFIGNLATLDAEKEIYSTNENKSKELLNTIRSLEIVEDRRRNDSESKDIFIIRNNIGVCYNLLYNFTENLGEAKKYLDSAESSYKSILNDKSLKLNYPADLSQVVYNFTLNSIDIGFNQYSVPTYYQMLALKICNSKNSSLEGSSSQIIDTLYIKFLYSLYLKYDEVEKFINDENNSYKLVAIINSIAKIKIQLIMYSNDYYNNNYNQGTFSLIFKANYLANQYNYFREIIFSEANRSSLDILKLLYNITSSTDDLMQSTIVLESLLVENPILKLYEAYLKRMLMLNYFFLSKHTSNPLQKNIYHRKASQLSNDVIEKYKELNYYRDYEEAVRIQKIINESN